MAQPPAQDVGGLAYHGPVAGLIRREDIEAVRERARIEDVVGEHVLTQIGRASCRERV